MPHVGPDGIERGCESRRNIRTGEIEGRCSRRTHPMAPERWVPISRITVNGTGNWCLDCARAYRRSGPDNPRSTRRSRSNERTFGVELEWTRGSADPYSVAREMTSRGLDCRVEGYNHTTRTWWKIVRDVSCGYELVSPVLQGDEGHRQVALACEAMQAAGAKVNRQCGLHVHHGASGETLETIQAFVTLYAEHQGLIDLLLAPSRRGTRNGMCWPINELGRHGGRPVVQRVAAVTENGLRAWGSEDRYHSVNPASYARHGTIEIRQHQGTTEGEKVSQWVRLGQALWSAARDGRTVSTRNLRAMLTDLGVDADYWIERAAQLHQREPRSHGTQSTPAATYMMATAE